MTAVLLCVTVSLAGLATAAGAARPPAQAAAPPAFPPAVQHQFQQALDQTVANPNVPGAIVGICASPASPRRSSGRSSFTAPT